VVWFLPTALLLVVTNLWVTREAPTANGTDGGDCETDFSIANFYTDT
jgi:hypothetical protein